MEKARLEAEKCEMQTKIDVMSRQTNCSAMIAKQGRDGRKEGRPHNDETLEELRVCDLRQTPDRKHHKYHHERCVVKTLTVDGAIQIKATHDMCCFCTAFFFDLSGWLDNGR